MSLMPVFVELRRAYQIVRSYWLEYVADFALYTIGFLLLMVVFRAASPGFGSQGYLSALIGYLTWKMCATVLIGIADMIDDEVQAGTLEQLFLVGKSPLLVFCGRTLGLIANQGLRAGLLGLGLSLILDVLRPISWLAVLVFLLTLIGAAGLGFALAGLILVYKRLGGATTLIWQMLVFFTGALVPFYQPVLEDISHLLPLSLGIESLRAIFLQNVDFAALWQSGLFPGLLMNTLFYSILGVALFRWGERRAREFGLLAQY
jgi:ABC-type polysaccharide/polyol phosphate export permease